MRVAGPLDVPGPPDRPTYATYLTYATYATHQTYPTHAELVAGAVRLYLVTQGMPLDTWQEQLRRGSLDLAILLTVASGPRYGLAIIQHLEAFTDLVVTEGTIYPILGRLTREGLLASQWVEGEAPHPRKYYTLTRAGTKRLSDMKVQWRAFAEKIDRLIAAAERG